MGSSRRLHALALVAAAAGVAAGQAGRPPGQAAAPRPAGSSPVESSDVPAWQPSPARFAVAPFENVQNIRPFDWLVAGAPFEIAQKTEDVLGLEPTGGPLHVGGARVIAEPEPVAAFARERAAQWVITGWVDRPNWQLRIDLTLWKPAGTTAVVAAQAARAGDPRAYHQLLGEALGELWKGAGMTIDLARAARLQRPLAADVYAVNLMSRGLGHLTGALGAVNLKAAEHDLERSVLIDPKCAEAQRLVGEMYLAVAPGDPRVAARAAGKFAYANDLAPDDIASLRAAATAAVGAGKHDQARELFARLVTRRPWDLDARYQLGAALWHTGHPEAAERQLDQVTARTPDHLPARRVLALIHSSRSDTAKLVRELEAIALRAPADLEVKADLATAYGATGQWPRAVAALEQIAAVRPADLALAVRVGDALRRGGDLGAALVWYARAQRIAPDSSFPAFISAQALVDANRLPEAIRVYTGAQRFRDELAAAEQALGALALLQDRPDDAAWYLRRAVRSAPRVLLAWRAEVAAELRRNDPRYALIVLDRAFAVWPRDGELLYLAGVAHAMLDERRDARALLTRALEAMPGHAGARAALGALDAGGSVTVAFVPELVRPWGDAAALDAMLARFATTAAEMAKVRAAYQGELTRLLGALGKGPGAPIKAAPVRICPIARLAPGWAAAQQQLRAYERLGGELEAAHRFIARHDDIGATAALMPSARAQVAVAKRTFRTALADVAELRAEWVRGLGPELRVAGCSDRLLAAAVADPARYRLIEEDRPDPIPAQQPPRPRPRATFYVDNSRCPDEVEVWVDGAHVGQVAPGRRSALVGDGGERTLCLLVPGAAQCGDKGTVRQVYLHDGWATTMYCPR